jgi:hypothetical protein
VVAASLIAKRSDPPRLTPPVAAPGELELPLLPHAAVTSALALSDAPTAERISVLRVRASRIAPSCSG